MDESGLDEIGIDDIDARARAVLTALSEGSYPGPDGSPVDIRALVRAAWTDTIFVRAGELPRAPGRHASTRVEVTTESTGAALARLARERPAARRGALNFANGITPGGGFLGGARAQEEQLCRCSSLYACLTVPAGDPLRFYAANAATGSALVDDVALVSPAVPFFADDDFAPYPTPILATVITSAAPDRGWLFAAVDSGREPKARFDEIPAVFARRTALVLDAAADDGVDALVLGAWGCGAFGNDPEVVARAFRAALAARPGAFAHVVFAIRGGGKNHDVFARVLDEGASR